MNTMSDTGTQVSIPTVGTVRGAVPPVLTHPTTDAHLRALGAAMVALRADGARLARWGTHVTEVLAVQGGRLLTAGNGGSAAQAQHLAAELVGKLRQDRRPMSALALHAETSSLTAIANDYGYERVYAREVQAHGRPGDILLLMSTSGASANLRAAAGVGRALGLTVWGLTGSLPNPLAACCDDVLAVESDDNQTIQELHLVAIHLLCEHVDAALPGVMAGAWQSRREP